MENKTKRFLKVALVLMLVVAMLPQITIGAKAADTADTVTAYCEHESHNQNGICAIEGCGVAVGHTYDRATGLCDCGAKEPPKSDAIAAYTSATTIWGETWGNARESYAIKVLDASGNVMGTTTLNTKLDVSMDGDVKVSWHITLPGNADADACWIQEWTIAPTLGNMPAKVELWIDGVKTSESAIQLNGPDGINKIVAVIANANSEITGYATSFEAALDAAPDNGIVKLLSGPNVVISAAGVVCGKTVTVTGTAKFDWSKGWLYVGREGTGDGKLIFKETTITSDEASLMNDTYGIHVSGAKAENKGNTYDGTVVFENSDIQLSYLLNRNEVTVDGGKLYVGRGFYIHGRNAGESYSATDETATITIKNGAVVEVKQNNGTGIGSESYGVMNIEGATFKAHESGFALRENGTINISGNSSVSMNLSGDGAVNVAAGTSLTDTTIAGAGTVKFNTGVTNFYGSNTVTAKIDSSVADFDLVVNKGATLLISRYVLGYDRDITVYGEIKDAHDFDPTGKTPSLKFDSTSGVSIGGTDTGKLTVQDAYVELDSSSLKAGATGTYEWNFKNAYVKAASLLNTNAAGTGGSMTLNFADSVVASGYIKNGTGVTYNFTDGSVATTGSICINGVLNIDETSSITTTAYQNNKKGAQDEHGDISGTVNVAGKLTIGSTAATDVELYGGELNVNGGTLDLGTNSLILDAASTVKVTVPGTITAKTITIPDTITIDATNLEAGKEYTVIVLDGTESLEGKVEFVGNVVATYGADGDVTIEKAVAKVGETNYTSLEAAIAAADGDTILLTADVDYGGTATLVIDKAITLDTNDHKLTAQVVLAHEDAKFVADESMKESVSTSVTDKKVGYDNAAGIYSVVNFTVAGSNVTLGNDLALNFWVRKADLSGTGYTAEIIKGNTVEYVAMNEWTTVYDDDGVEYHQIPFGGMAAKEMNDEVSVQIFKDGKAISNKFTDSVVEYAKFMFANSNDKELHTMLVDMLNYGAAAQKAFNYNTDNLANSILSEEQKKVPAANTDDMDDKWNGGKIGYGSNLELKDNIILHIWFRNANITKAVISYTDHSGKTVEVSTSSFKDRLPGISSVAVDTLVVADGNQTITVDFYSGDTKVGTVTESIESYLKYMLEKNGGNELYNATAKFVASSYDLFH